MLTMLKKTLHFALKTAGVLFILEHVTIAIIRRYNEQVQTPESYLTRVRQSDVTTISLPPQVFLVYAMHNGDASHALMMSEALRDALGDQPRYLVHSNANGAPFTAQHIAVHIRPDGAPALKPIKVDALRPEALHHLLATEFRAGVPIVVVGSLDEVRELHHSKELGLPTVPVGAFN